LQPPLRVRVWLTAGILLRGPERSEGHVSRNVRVIQPPEVSPLVVSLRTAAYSQR